VPFRSSLWCLLLATAGLASRAVAPCDAAAAPPRSGADLISVSEIHSGMKGIGLTVFRGSRVDTFGVEVLGVLRRYQPGRDLILVRASGGPLEQTGIIAGMSGSPIYIDGRLAGALAYAYPFAKEAIAGVTPIGDMLAYLDRGGPADTSAALEGAALPPEGLAVPPDAQPPFEGEGTPAAPEDETGMLSPARMPLMVSGFSEPVVEDMRAFFGERGLVVAQGGVTDAPLSSADLVPGSAVSVRLVEGDANIAAIGTLTMRDGDRVLAFGHPLFHAGRVSLPLSGATIEALLPSQNVSIKFGSASDTDVGVIDQDRSTGIGGRIGPAPAMIPITLHVEAPGAPRTDYHYRVIRNRDLTPGVVRWVVMNSVSTREQSSGTETMEITTKVTLGDGRSFTRRDVSADVAPPGEAGDQVTQSVQWILQNTFERASIREIDVGVKVDPAVRAVSVERLAVDRGSVKPGGVLRGRVRLRPYRGAPYWKEFEIRVPESLPGEHVILEAADGGTVLQRDLERAPGSYEPASLDELLRMIGELPSKDKLYIRLYTIGGRGLVLMGREMGPLPPSVAAVFESRRRSGGVSKTQATVAAEETIDVGAVASGAESMKLRIERPMEEQAQ
jgi:hypothetical protein